MTRVSDCGTTLTPANTNIIAIRASRASKKRVSMISDFISEGMNYEIAMSERLGGE